MRVRERERVKYRWIKRSERETPSFSIRITTISLLDYSLHTVVVFGVLVCDTYRHGYYISMGKISVGIYWGANKMQAQQK